MSQWPGSMAQKSNRDLSVEKSIKVQPKDKCPGKEEEAPQIQPRLFIIYLTVWDLVLDCRGDLSSCLRFFVYCVIWNKFSFGIGPSQKSNINWQKGSSTWFGRTSACSLWNCWLWPRRFWVGGSCQQAALSFLSVHIVSEMSSILKMQLIIFCP